MISLSIKIDYWDGFTQLANARAIYTQQKSFFFVFRPLFISLINVPIISLKDLGASFFTILGLSHLLSFLIGVLLLLTTYLFLRDSFTPGIALLTTVLFSLNRLFIHYTPLIDPLSLKESITSLKKITGRSRIILSLVKRAKVTDITNQA